MSRLGTFTTREGRYPQNSASIIGSLLASVDSSQYCDDPYPYWLLSDCLPAAAVEDVLNLPFPAPMLDGVSGRREIHNATRTYFDRQNNEAFPVCRDISAAFNDPQVTRHLERAFDLDLSGTYLRIEFAQDIDGFWLEPHTDLGVKRFTMLLYLSSDPSHHDLGTDIYDRERRHVGRSPFFSNHAMVFVPSDRTFHGFEKRRISGVRKSVIINYVTRDWKAREQLVSPDNPIGRA